MTVALRDGGAEATRPLLAVQSTPLDDAELTALFPDFRILRGAASPDSDYPVLAWSRMPRAPAKAPVLAMADGLLRAPPRARLPAAPIGAVCARISGPASPADTLDPGRVLASTAWHAPDLFERAERAISALVRTRLGGAWWNAEPSEAGLPAQDRFALVSLEAPPAGLPDPPAVFRTMIETAIAENGAARTLVIGTEPRSAASSRLLAGAAAQGCIVIADPIPPWSAIERATSVYAAGGETGFLALLAGVKVRCFAPSFYSGWGVTEDAAGVPRREFGRTVPEIFAGACLVATRYLDPYRKCPARFEDLLEIVEQWRRVERANQRVAVCLGMSFWKRRRVADFFRTSRAEATFARTVKEAIGIASRGLAQPRGSIAVWASRAPAGLAEAAARHGIPLIRVEDGFIRSVGLGSDFMPAASLVLDSRGMHFDPSVQSDLELILREAEFPRDLTDRARRLIEMLVARGVTKYNLPSGAPTLEFPAGRRLILVPGQVEDDLSVRLGGGEVRGNLDLLRRVRDANPDAFILYKPHPDVEAGHRKGLVPDAEARGFADSVIRDVSTAALLAEIGELHTLTSLAGFEALLRGRRVVVYGRPFYAGWGLTTDAAPLDRGRRLSIEQLVAGALILYPRYIDPVTRLPCGPEVVIERLDNPELWRPGALVTARRWQGALLRRCSEWLARGPALARAPR